MKGNFRSLLKRFCVDGTVHGLKYFYLYPDRISRLFWTTALLAVLTLACRLTWLLYHRFTEMPTRISIENQYQPVWDLPYPAITLCSPNQLTITALNHFNKTLVDGNLTIDLEKVMPQLLGFYEYMELNYNALVHLQELIDLNRHTIQDVLASLPQRCDDFIKMCYFNGVLTSDCNSLFRPILTIHGLCCTFNSWYHISSKGRVEKDNNYKTKLVQHSGLLEGLSAVVDFNPDDALDHTLIFGSAIRVMVNDWTEFPSDDAALIIHTYSESYNQLQATYTYCSDEVKELNFYNRKCYFEDEHHLPYFNQYRNSDCDHVCFLLAVKHQCGCVLYYVPNVRPEHVCNATSIACIHDVKKNSKKWTSSECECPRDCESRSYQTDSIIGNIDGMDYMTTKPYGDLKFNKSSAIVNFFFKSPVYVKQKQETVMSIVTLFSNLGGVFGLCLGCSGISLLEMVYFFTTAIRNHLRRLRQTLAHRITPHPKAFIQ